MPTKGVNAIHKQMYIKQEKSPSHCV